MVVRAEKCVRRVAFLHVSPASGRLLGQGELLEDVTLVLGLKTKSIHVTDGGSNLLLLGLGVKSGKLLEHHVVLAVLEGDPCSLSTHNIIDQLHSYEWTDEIKDLDQGPEKDHYEHVYSGTLQEYGYLILKRGAKRCTSRKSNGPGWP